MSFLNPSWLWALPLALTPLIIHLLNIRPYKVIFFSHTKFLENLIQEQRKRTKLKEWIILLLRILALAMIILAFARPVIYNSPNSRPCKGSVIYLDNSFSMLGNGKLGENLEVAKKQAFMLTKVFPPSSKFMFLTNSFAIEQQRFYSALNVQDLILNTQAQPYIKDLSFVIQKIANLVNPDTTCKPYVFIFSDFQKSTSDIEKVKFPKNWMVYLVPVQSTKPSNVSVDTLYFATPYHVYNGYDSVTVVLRNYSDEPVEDLRVNFFLNDSLRALSNINLPPKATKKVDFKYQNSYPGWNSGYVSITDYPVTFDNKLFFSYFVKQKYKVLVVSNKPNKYLRAFYSMQPFELTWTDFANIPYSNLNSFSGVVLNGNIDFSSGLAQALKNYVNTGGSLLILPDTVLQGVNSLLSEFSLPLFSGIDTNRTEISKINLNSQLYAGTIKSLKPNSLMPKLFKYLRRKIDFGKETPLLTASNGQVVLSQFAFGKGKLYIFDFALEKNWTNFQTQPLFVPTFYNSVIFTGVYTKPYFILSRDKLIKLPFVASGGEYYVLQNKNLKFIPQTRLLHQSVILDISSLMLPAGNYSLNSSDTLVARVSFNYWRGESNFDFYTPRDLERIIKNRKLANVKVVDIQRVDLRADLEKQINSRKIWKIFVIFALVFLFTEIIVNRLWK